MVDWQHETTDDTNQRKPDEGHSSVLMPSREDFASFQTKLSRSLPEQSLSLPEFETFNPPGANSSSTNPPADTPSPDEIEASRRKDQQNPNDHYDEDAHQFFPGIQNSFEVIPGLLYRGANPGGSNDETHAWTNESLYKGLQELKAQGITVDLDFERPENSDPCVASRIEAEKQACQELGIQFVPLEMNHKGPTQEQKDEFLNVINEARDNGGEVYSHCREGRDRTGYMVAYAREKLQGWSPAQAKAEDEADGYNDYKQGRYPKLAVPDTPML